MSNITRRTLTRIERYSMLLWVRRIVMERKVEIGRRIRAARHASGMRQDDLAHSAGIERAYMGRIERGDTNITVETLYRIADALKIRAIDLLPD